MHLLDNAINQATKCILNINPIHSVSAKSSRSMQHNIIHINTYFCGSRMGVPGGGRRSAGDGVPGDAARAVGLQATATRAAGLWATATATRQGSGRAERQAGAGEGEAGGGRRVPGARRRRGGAGDEAESAAGDEVGLRARGDGGPSVRRGRRRVGLTGGREETGERKMEGG